MAVWRRKAIEACPELRSELEACSSCGLAWFELLPALHHFERSGDTGAAQKIYDFAAWCWGQPDHRGSVATHFYEHLVDEPHTRDALHERIIDRAKFAALLPLFEARMDPAAFRLLVERYDETHKTSFARTR